MQRWIEENKLLLQETWIESKLVFSYTIHVSHLSLTFYAGIACTCVTLKDRKMNATQALFLRHWQFTSEFTQWASWRQEFRLSCMSQMFTKHLVKYMPSTWHMHTMHTWHTFMQPIPTQHMKHTQNTHNRHVHSHHTYNTHIQHMIYTDSTHMKTHTHIHKTTHEHPHTQHVHLHNAHIKGFMLKTFHFFHFKDHWGL